MTALPPRAGVLAELREALDSPRFSAILTTLVIGTMFLSHAIRSVLGWPGFIGALGLLTALSLGVLLVRREQFEWRGILPVSLLAFIGWCALSVLWSEYQWSTVSGVLYQVTVGVLAVFVAIGRDLIQIVRALGDVLRFVLGLSLALEIFSGIIIDTPLRFIGIAGSIASGGPIQGVLGSRNMLGLVCLIAALTFTVELVTRSVRRPLGVASLVLAALIFGLTRSPIGGFIGIGVGVAATALVLVRRAPAESRRRYQLALAALATAGTVIAYLARFRIVDLFNGRGELSLRLDLWRKVSELTTLSSTEGWGWVGAWRPDLFPFSALRTIDGRAPTSALNAFVDVWLQIGGVGLLLFLVFLGLALTRAWIVASGRRNVAHVWPALMLVALTIASMAESSVLSEFGWFLLVVCAVKAAQELSWRKGLR